MTTAQSHRRGSGPRVRQPTTRYAKMGLARQSKRVRFLIAPPINPHSSSWSLVGKTLAPRIQVLKADSIELGQPESFGQH
jgi:hypothetical protein